MCQDGAQMPGDGGCRIDHRHAGAGNATNRLDDEGIVRAGEHDGVGAGVEDRLQESAQQRFRGRAVEVAGFHVVGQAVADLIDEADARSRDGRRSP